MVAEIKISNIRRVPGQFEDRVREIHQRMLELYEYVFSLPQILMADVQLATDQYSLRDVGLNVGGKIILSSSLVLYNRGDALYVATHELSEELFDSRTDTDGIASRNSSEELQGMKSCVKVLEHTGCVKRDDYITLLRMYKDFIYWNVFREGSAEAIALHTLSSMSPYNSIASDKRQKAISRHRSVLAHKVFDNRTIFSSLDGLMQDVETMVTDENVESYIPQMNQQMSLIERNIPIMRVVQTEYGFVLADRIFDEYGLEGLISVANMYPPNRAIYFEDPNVFLNEFGKRINEAVGNKGV